MKNLCTEEDNKAAVSQSCGAERNQRLLMFSMQTDDHITSIYIVSLLKRFPLIYIIIIGTD